MADATALGITGTPTFLIGTVDRANVVQVRERLEGTQPMSVFRLVLDPIDGRREIAVASLSAFRVHNSRSYMSL